MKYKTQKQFIYKISSALLIVTSAAHTIEVRVVASGDAQLEMGVAARKADLLADALGKSVHVRLIEGEAPSKNVNTAPRTFVEIPGNGKQE
jgi:hypothetical protein